MYEVCKDQPELEHGDTRDSDLYGEIFEKYKNGRVRGFGLDSAPTDVWVIVPSLIKWLRQERLNRKAEEDKRKMEEGGKKSVKNYMQLGKKH